MNPADKLSSLLSSTLASALLHKIEQGAAGLCLYGLAPPKRAIEAAQLAEVIAQQERRFAELEAELDGLVVYDIQDESVRTDQPRPFPFLPTIDPERYAYQHLAGVRAPKIVYRSVGQASRAEFQRWLAAGEGGPGPHFAVLVGAPSANQRGDGLPLAEAYALARGAARLVLGGIAIAERHGRKLDEHLRMLAKMDQGCRFFVTQAVYDVTSTKSLLSDYALRLAELGRRPAPVILTFAPCGSARTLEFMKWLGISFPRWLENELRFASDSLATSMRLCEQIFDELAQFAADKGIPVGINVESVSIRKVEVEASLALFRSLSRRARAG